MRPRRCVLNNHDQPHRLAPATTQTAEAHGWTEGRPTMPGQSAVGGRPRLRGDRHSRPPTREVEASTGPAASGPHTPKKPDSLETKPTGLRKGQERPGHWRTRHPNLPDSNRRSASRAGCSESESASRRRRRSRTSCTHRHPRRAQPRRQKKEKRPTTPPRAEDGPNNNRTGSSKAVDVISRTIHRTPNSSTTPMTSIGLKRARRWQASSGTGNTVGDAYPYSTAAGVLRRIWQGLCRYLRGLFSPSLTAASTTRRSPALSCGLRTESALSALFSIRAPRLEIASSTTAGSTARSNKTGALHHILHDIKHIALNIRSWQGGNHQEWRPSTTPEARPRFKTSATTVAVSMSVCYFISISTTHCACTSWEVCTIDRTCHTLGMLGGNDRGHPLAWPFRAGQDSRWIWAWHRHAGPSKINRGKTLAVLGVLSARPFNTSRSTYEFLSTIHAILYIHYDTIITWIPERRCFLVHRGYCDTNSNMKFLLLLVSTEPNSCGRFYKSVRHLRSRDPTEGARPNKAGSASFDYEAIRTGTVFLPASKARQRAGLFACGRPHSSIGCPIAGLAKTHFRAPSMHHQLPDIIASRVGAFVHIETRLMCIFTTNFIATRGKAAISRGRTSMQHWPARGKTSVAGALGNSSPKKPSFPRQWPFQNLPLFRHFWFIVRDRTCALGKSQKRFCGGYPTRNGQVLHRKPIRYFTSQVHERYRHFDSTLGYPGEGHKDNRRKLSIVSANITSWYGGKNAIDRGDFDDTDILCLQEHRISDPHNMEIARKWLKGKGWDSHCSLAIVTAKGGRSGGTAVLWRSHVHVSNIVKDFPGEDEGRASAIEIVLADFGSIMVSTIYGSTGNIDRTLALLEQKFFTYGKWAMDHYRRFQHGKKDHPNLGGHSRCCPHCSGLRQHLLLVFRILQHRPCHHH